MTSLPKTALPATKSSSDIRPKIGILSWRDMVPLSMKRSAASNSSNKVNPHSVFDGGELREIAVGFSAKMKKDADFSAKGCFHLFYCRYPRCHLKPHCHAGNRQCGHAVRASAG